MATARVSALFPEWMVRKECDEYLTRQLAESASRVTAGAVVPTVDFERFREALAKFDFQAGRPLTELLSWTIAQMERGVVHITHPRYFGLFNPAPTFPAQCADRITAGFNPQLATSTTSPVPVAIEAHMIRSVARRAGFPAEVVGHFTTGGAEANYTALICALTRANPNFANEGSRAFTGQPYFYISRESHLAWIKIAHQAGIGRSAARLIETDGSGRMDVRRLAEAVRADRARGYVPVMIVATAGTTNAGMIDPLRSCAGIARESGLWYHVDAAWGGAVIASPKLACLLSGMEQADSATIDAHKWFATTMGCGMFITRHGPVLSSAFHVSTNYMPSTIAAVDPYVTSVQWSRRFAGLRLFLSLGAAGWDGYKLHVERCGKLAGLLKDALTARGWSVVNDISLAVLCIEPPAGSVSLRTIVSRVLASGRAWISVTTFENRQFIRACVTNGETTEADIAELVDAMVTASC